MNENLQIVSLKSGATLILFDTSLESDSASIIISG
jgi:hypothetical protein